MKGFVFSCKCVKGDHTGNSLFEDLKGMVAEWGLVHTEVSLPVYVETDNTQNLDSTIAGCSWILMQCLIHILKLGIGDAKEWHLVLKVFAKRAYLLLGITATSQCL
jgi:hypothetical protein